MDVRFKENGYTATGKSFWLPSQRSHFFKESVFSSRANFFYFKVNFFLEGKLCPEKNQEFTNVVSLC